MRVLIFGTAYIDTLEKVSLYAQWATMNMHLNHDACDLLLVDSASPRAPEGSICTLQLGDNIGHLSRGGRDGWGRAFCAGLQVAIDNDYDYVVHVESDSLCRLRVREICEKMEDSGGLAWGVPVRGTKHVEHNWVETGLMFLDVEFIEESRLIERYDWQNGAAKAYPRTPEFVLHDLLGEELEMQHWKNMRDDCRSLTVDSVREYDWISHAAPEVSAAFFSQNVSLS